MRFAGWQSRRRGNPCGCPHRNPHGNPHGGACESVSGSTEVKSLTFSSGFHTFDMAMAPYEPQPNTNEVCYVLVGQRRDHIWVGQLRKRREGSPTSVEFDWGWVMVREESFGDVIGFYHTHPTGKPEPSLRDVRTMQAWVDSFGKALLCVIESRGNPGPLFGSCRSQRGGGACLPDNPRACPTLAGYVFEQDSYTPVNRINRVRTHLVIVIS